MWMLDVLWLVAVPFASGGVAVYLMSWGIRRLLRNLQFDLAVLEDRLLREIKRRASETRWSGPGEPPADVEAAVKELRALAIGEEDGKGFKQGKEGGVYRGTI